jgi:hypothetical protein
MVGSLNPVEHHTIFELVGDLPGGVGIIRLDVDGGATNGLFLDVNPKLWHRISIIPKKLLKENGECYGVCVLSHSSQ